jgi:hypothetical protein
MKINQIGLSRPRSGTHFQFHAEFMKVGGKDFNPSTKGDIS